jgi:hypothetical protein
MAKLRPQREPDATTVHAAVDAFLSSPRCNPNTRRGYAGVLDRMLADLGAGWRLACITGDVDRSTDGNPVVQLGLRAGRSYS